MQKSHSNYQKAEDETAERTVRVLEKATVEYSSTKTQFLLGAALALIASLIAVRKTFGIGFMAGDITRVNAMSQALHGQMEILRTHLDALLLADYFLFHMNDFGYHFVSWLAVALCTVLVGLITLELSGRLGNRGGALSAFWAALLFAAYPGQIQNVALLGERGHILIALFYLFSVFAFMRYKLINEKPFLRWSLISAAFAMTSASAISLPLVITAMSLSGKKSLLVHSENKVEVAYWLMAALSLSAHWPHPVDLIPAADLLKLLMPYGKGALALTLALAPLAVVGLVCFSKAVFFGSAEERASGYLKQLAAIAFVLAAVCLTSNNSLITSAWLVILVAFATLEIDIATKRTALAFVQAGLFAVSTLFLSWSFTGSQAVEPIVEADRLVRSFVMQIEALRSTSDRLVLANMPKSHEGIALTRGNDDLKLLLTQPFTAADYSSGTVVLTQENNLIDLSAVDKDSDIYLWNQKQARLKKLDSSKLANTTGNNIEQVPEDLLGSAVSLAANKQWQLVKAEANKIEIVRTDSPTLVLDNSKAKGATLSAGEQADATLWFDEKIELPVLNCNRWLLKIKTNSDKVTLTVKNLSSGDTEEIVGKTAGPYKFFDLRQCDSYIFSEEPQALGLTVKKGNTAAIADMAYIDLQSLKKPQEQK